MNRRLLLTLAGCCLINVGLAPADDTPPFANVKQYSEEMTVVSKDMNMTNKMFIDDGKIRCEITMSGLKGIPGMPNMPDMQTVSIARLDQKKIYVVMPAQKTVMMMPYDPAQMQKAMAQTYMTGKFDLIGPDTVNGVACTKYKTVVANQTLVMWMDNAKKIPIMATALDGSVTILFSNFKEGPQDPALFEPPTGYQVVPMPTIPGMPPPAPAPAPAPAPTPSPSTPSSSSTGGSTPDAQPKTLPPNSPSHP
jgi:hypothetical protein